MVALWLTLGVLSGCREDLGPRDGKRDSEAVEAWGNLLGQVVTDDGLVDYDRLAAQRAVLDRYLVHLSARSVLDKKGPKIRHALWLNAYNALVLHSVLERGRPASVLDVEGLLPVPGVGFFVATQYEVGGELVSLWDIEHERLRLYYQDLRDHGALNCASRACPPLRPSLYTVPGLGEQLDEQMRVWLNDPARGVWVDGDTAVFSALFDWYARDFEVWSAGRDPCSVAAEYADEPLASALAVLSAQGCPRRFMDYDWSLNQAG